MPEEYSILDNWAGNEAEEQYVVTKNAAGATVITYTDVTGEDSGGWQYVKRSFAYDAAKVARFSEYKKVVFEGNLVKTAGTDIVMVKVEGAGGTFEKARSATRPSARPSPIRTTPSSPSSGSWANLTMW